jgi:hypothetical protein
MRAYLANLTSTTKTGMLLVVPLVVIAYPIVTIIVPALLRAVIPDVVRSVLSLI